jgi:hypothetical protein
MMIYRLISVRFQHVYFMQSSFRLFFKASMDMFYSLKTHSHFQNGKPDSIGGNHRILT